MTYFYNKTDKEEHINIPLFQDTLDICILYIDKYYTII